MFGVCDVAAAPSGAQQDRDNIGQPLGKTPHSIRARSRLRAYFFFLSIKSLSLSLSPPSIRLDSMQSRVSKIIHGLIVN